MPRSPSGSTRLSSYEEAWEAINHLIREGGSWSGSERNCFYLNAGDGTFVNASAASGLDFIDDGRAFAVADLDHDGDPDLILKNRTGPQVRILRNDLSPRGGRVSFRLEGRGANRDAVGARVTLRVGGKVRTKSVKCGSGFLSQNSPWLHFAFPGLKTAERVEVRWPGGRRQELGDLALDRRWRIVEGQAPVWEELRPASRRGDDAGPPEVATPGSMAREAWLLAELYPPDLAFETLSGKPVRASDFRGRDLLLNFYSPRCPLCVGELRERAARRDQIAASGLAVLLVRADPAEDGSGMDQPALTAPPFTLARADGRAVAAYGVLVHQALRWPPELEVPLSCLIDRAGKLVKLYRGPVSLDRLARDRGLLAQAANPSRLGLPFAGTFHDGEPRRDDFQLGIGYEEAGLHDLARSSFRRAIERRGDDAEALFNLGVVADSPEESRRCFESAAALHPDFVDAHTNLGVVLARAGDLTGAEASFREALRLRPGHAEALLNLGSVRLARGEGEEALEVYRAAVAANPDLPAVRKRLGETLRRLGRKEEAIAAFREAAGLDPEDAEIRSNLGVVLAERGRLDEAAAELEAAARARPGYAAALNNLGLVEDRRGRTGEARKSYRSAMEADPALPEPYLNLARSLLRSGENAEASRVLKTLLRVHPGHPAAAEMLAEIRPISP